MRARLRLVAFVRLALWLPLLLAVGVPAAAETGYDLWLRYVAIDDARVRETYAATLGSIAVDRRTPTGRVIAAEIERALTGMLGAAPTFVDPSRAADLPSATLVIGTPAGTPFIKGLPWATLIDEAGDEGFVIRTVRTTPSAASAASPVASAITSPGASPAASAAVSPATASAASAAGLRTVTVIASRTEVGALYGTFHLLRLIQTRQPLGVLDIVQRPRLARRLLNHWDNLDGSIERGYAGRSLWLWDELPARVDPRVHDYARANASLGINGTVINSVNANPKSLTAPYLEKAAAIANTLRPYGIRVYLAPNFAAPRTLGGLPTADPLDPAVARWWKDKAAEIYRLIPDFGGFLVKANSEGQPGPQDYGRTHADGANVLADAVRAQGGIVMWRAFVYNADVDPDRVKRANLEFVPLDGTFRDNVMVQVKNGPLDFMPREPFHPLFGAMPRTPLMAELQVTQEYLGHSTHLVYLAPMWKEFLDADTYTAGPGSPVSRIVDGSLAAPPDARTGTGIAGVANTGSDRNWTGHHFGQANWYAFGRLAWDPGLDAGAIADEWIAMTWGQAPDLVAAIRAMMLDSRELFVDYTMPVGLHHLIGGNHYAVMPENAKAPRADWTATYYHRADAAGVGFDRTARGSDAVSQYRSPLREQWSDPKTTPEKLLLWFHHLPWDYRLASGRTLWDTLVSRYTRGALEARGLEARWAALQGRVDDERHRAVAAKLRQQVEDAAAWRDKCLRYFQQFSKGALPELPAAAPATGPAHP